MRTILIDDEKKARDSIKNILNYSDLDIDIVGEGENVVTGLKLIQVYNPELIILDIKMPDGSGFDILKQIQNQRFKLIFITAYELFAVKAFEFSAIDYLLKPIDPGKLIQSVKRAEKLVANDLLTIKMSTLVNNIDADFNKLNRLVLHTDQKIHVIEINDIIYCKSDLGYTTFFLRNRIKIMVSKNLKYYEELLQKFNFFRPHQSYLFNLTYIDYYSRKDGGCIVLKGGIKIPISFRKKEKFLSVLNSI